MTALEFDPSRAPGLDRRAPPRGHLVVSGPKKKEELASSGIMRNGVLVLNSGSFAVRYLHRKFLNENQIEHV